MSMPILFHQYVCVCPRSPQAHIINCGIELHLSAQIAGQCAQIRRAFSLPSQIIVQQCNCQMFGKESIHQQFPPKHSHGLHPDHALISDLLCSRQNTVRVEIWAKRRPSAHHHHPSSFCAFPSASNVCQWEQRWLGLYSYSWDVSPVSQQQSRAWQKGK